MAGVMGFGSPPAATGGGFLDKMQTGFGGLLGIPNDGSISPEARRAMLMQAMGAMGGNLMAQSGWSPQRVSFGQALGNSLLATQQQVREGKQDELQALLLKTKLQKAKEGPKQPADVQSYEYAKANGYKGTFADWKRIAAAQAQPTSDVQNWEYFQKLNPEQQKQWMSLQRQPTAPQLAVINGVPTLVDRIQGTQTPLTTQTAEIEAAAGKKQAEAQASAIGTAMGEAKGTVEKRALAANNVKDLLDVADPLVDVATGSTIGAGADKLAAVFGTSLKGDQATAQLKILQAALMFAQPRMEGPQGVLDVKLYEQAAGELGDPTVPRERKKAAIKTIRDLQTKYATAGGASTAPAQRPPLSSFQK